MNPKEGKIELSKFTHEEQIWLCAVGIAGNMRGVIWQQLKEKGADELVTNEKVNDLFNTLMKTVTEEDWIKAKAMIEEKYPGSFDEFKQQETKTETFEGDDPFKSFAM